MDFFEKLSKKASETYKSAAEKTNKIANDTKLKLKINDNKSKIEDIYTQIGKKVYQKYVLDGNLDIKDDIKEELERIKQLSDEIEGFETQRLDLSDMKQCPNCKNKIDKEAKFCPNCGAEQPEDEIEVKVVLEDEATANSQGNSAEENSTAEGSSEDSAKEANSTEDNSKEESSTEGISMDANEDSEKAENVAEDTEEMVVDVVLEDDDKKEEDSNNK